MTKIKEKNKTEKLKISRNIKYMNKTNWKNKLNLKVENIYWKNNLTNFFQVTFLPTATFSNSLSFPSGALPFIRISCLNFNSLPKNDFIMQNYNNNCCQINNCGLAARLPSPVSVFCDKNLSKIETFDQNQKHFSKIWSKIENFVNNRTFLWKIENFVKNLKFCQKSKIWSKIENFVKDQSKTRTLCLNSKFRP